MNVLAICLIALLQVTFICSQSQCKNFLTCGGCIGYELEECVWCAAHEHTESRCKSKSSVNPSWCKEPIYDPQNHRRVVSNKDFSDGKDNTDVIQFKPQAMEIKVRPSSTRDPIQFKMYYKPAKDYPLDVYYLIDSTDTMKDFKNKLFEQALEIYARLSEITNNVKLGVGSFIEKPALPYVDSSTQLSYSFKHHQSLTNDTGLFTKAMEKLKRISGTNNDEPEAGFDALMQAMVCKEEIGWRDSSHRIILLSTDSTYHSAGDGKFVGAIIPNDMKCHLENGDYTQSLTFDYPSVSQINKVATDKNIRIIFAAAKSVEADYKALETKIKNAKYVELLNKGNLVNMIINEYQQLRSDVLINVKTPSFMSLTLEPDCTKRDQCLYEHNKPVEINGTLKVKYCPTDQQYNYDISIGPMSIDEKLILKVETLCQCACEKPDQGERDSDKCSKAGIFQCGICQCNADRYGDICNCTETSEQDFKKCKLNEDDIMYCSGRGECRCGVCTNCKKGFSGDFCEFDNNSCEKPGGLLCAGNGKCTYGKCACDQGWLPPDCSCTSDNQKCIAPYSKEVCSGRGECACGRCNCNSNTTSKEYCGGTYCDECPESSAARCPELEDYAYCNVIMDKATCDEKHNFTYTDVVLVNKTEIYSQQWYMAKAWCRKTLEDGRTLVFRYHYPKYSTLRLIIQTELEMAPVAAVWVTVGSVIGSILLIGLITIAVWKFLVDLHDKREYEKFEQESKNAGYDVSLNPLYTSPATDFRNPAYNHCD